MVFSHALVHANGAVLFPLAAVVAFIARFAPVLFFSVSGVVNSLQAQRHPLRYFATFAALFAVLGLSYNTLWRPDLLHNLESDIPQFAGMTILCTVLVAKAFSKRAVFGYTLVAVVLALVHFLLVPLLPPFPGRQFLTIPGVFPLVPWLIFPFLGNIAYRLPDHLVRRIALSLLVLTGSALLASYGYAHTFGPVWTDKFNMPLGYFLLCVTVQFGMFALLRRWQALCTNSWVLYVGRNSFAFLFCHLIWRGLFIDWQIFHPLLVWPALLILAVTSVKVLDTLNTRYFARIFALPAPWVTLALLMVLQSVALPGQPYLMTLCGLIFAFNYRGLSQAVKSFTEKPRPVPAARVPQDA